MENPPLHCVLAGLALGLDFRLIRHGDGPRRTGPTPSVADPVQDTMKPPFLAALGPTRIGEVAPRPSLPTAEFVDNKFQGFLGRCRSLDWMFQSKPHSREANQMSIHKRYAIAAVCVAVMALGTAGCGDSSEVEGPAGGYDAQGFPLNENGEVSSNPQDYHQSLCETEMFENDPSC